MSKAVPWSIKGVDFDAREAAKLAARRAGMTLGEWMNGVITAHAREMGLKSEDLDEHARLEAIAARLARMAANDTAPRGTRRSDTPGAMGAGLTGEQHESSRDGDRTIRARRHQVQPQTPTGREVSFEDRTFRSPRRKEQDPEALLDAALESLGRRNRSSLLEAEGALEKVSRRLADIEAHLAPGVSEQPNLVRDSLARLEARIDEIAGAAPGPNGTRDFDEALRKVDRRIEEIAARFSGRNESLPARGPEFDRLEAKLEDVVRRAASAPKQDHRLDSLERKIGEIAENLSAQGARDRDADVARIESKLNMLLNRTAAPAAMATAAAAASARSDMAQRADHAPAEERSPNTQRRALLQEAVAEISRHQRELDARPSMPEPAAYSALKADISALAQSLEAMREEMRRELAPRANKGPGLEDLRGEIAGLQHAIGQAGDRSGMREEIARVGQQIDALKRATETPRGPSPEIETLRGEIAALSRSLAGLAPREDISSLTREVRDLATRLEMSREGGIREGVLRPVEDLLRDLHGALADLARRPVTDVLEREVRTIGAKIEALSDLRLEPEAFDRILGQTAEIRDLLARTASLPMPAEAISRQLAELNDRMDRLAQNQGQTGAFEIDLGVRSVRAALEQVPGVPYLRALGERMEALGARIDELAERMDRPVSAPDPHTLAHMEGLSRKIDDVMERIEQPAPGLDTRELERMMREISVKLEQPAPAPDLGPLERLMADIARKLERPAQIPAGGLSALEGVMREVSQKLERAAAGPTEEVRALQATVAALSERIERQARAQSANHLEDVIRALAEKIDSVERRTHELQAPDGSLVEMVRGIADRIEAVRAPQADLGSFDALQVQIERLAQKIDRPEMDSPAIAGLQNSLASLFGQFEHMRDAAIDAASDAARNAARDALREVVPGFEPPEAVTREIADLRSAQDAADRRMHATLSAVHETLEKVVDRLATIEDEMAEARPGGNDPDGDGPHPFRKDLEENGTGLLASGPAPNFTRSAATSDAVKTGKVSADLPIDEGFLIEPGSGLPPQRRNEAVDADPRPDASSFIAAARRAVQANASSAPIGDEPADMVSEMRNRARAAAASVTGKSEIRSLGSMIRERRRPLLLGLAAVVVMLASLQVVRLYSTGPAPAANPVTTLAPKTQSAPQAPSAPGAAAPTQNGASLIPAPNAARSASAAVPSTRPQAENAKGMGAMALDPTPVASIPQKLTTQAPTAAASAAALTAPPAATAPTVTVASLPTSSITEIAAGGNRLAQYELADRYAEGRGGLPRDMAQAMKWFSKAAAQKLAPAQYRLAVLYEKGLGAPRDAEVARKLYKEAAEAGNVRAMHNLAVLTADVGGDGKPDYANAAKWFRKAAEHGVRDSQYNLAILYARGLGVPQNFEQSYVWFGIAAAQGDQDAGKKRDEIGDHLDAAKIAKAKAAILQFQPASRDVIANEVPASPTWDTGSKPTASLPRPAGISKV